MKLVQGSIELFRVLGSGYFFLLSLDISLFSILVSIVAKCIEKSCLDRCNLPACIFRKHYPSTSHQRTPQYISSVFLQGLWLFLASARSRFISWSWMSWFSEIMEFSLFKEDIFPKLLRFDLQS